MSHSAKIRKIKEGLRKPITAGVGVGVVYSPYSSTSTEEEIANKIKTMILTKMSELIREFEYAYNSSSSYYGSANNEADAKKTTDTLKPLEEMYDELKEMERKLVNYLQDLLNKKKESRKEDKKEDDGKEEKEEDKEEKEKEDE